MSEQDLDTRIRALVARAVADAPIAPELESTTALEPRRLPDDRHHRAWWLGGGAALLAAATAITAVVLVNDTDDRISTPVDSTPPTAPVTSSASTLPASTVPASTVVATVPGSTVPPSAVMTSVPPSTAPGVSDPVVTSPPVAGEVIAPDRIVVAGPDGVAVIEGGVELRRLDQPAESAFTTPGGAVIFQPARPTPDGDPGDPLIWRPDGTVERLLGVPGERQSYRLHDVADIDGVPTVLYGVATRAAGEGSAMDVSQFTETLHALSMTPGNWTDVVLDSMQTWEAGWSQLSLTSDGLVVGEQSELVSHHLYSVVLPGSRAAAGGPLAAVALGLADSYGDEVSPRSFGVSSDGTTVAWTFDTELVVHTLATGEQRRWPYAGLADAATRSVDVRDAGDGEVVTIVVSGWPQTAEGTQAVQLTLAADGAVTPSPVTVRFASLAP